MPTTIELAKKIVSDHMTGNQQSNLKLEAASAHLSETATRELTASVQFLHSGLSDMVNGIRQSLQDHSDCLAQQVNNIITSNESLAESNKGYSKAMNLLTAALVIVGILQVIAAFSGLSIQKKQIDFQIKVQNTSLNKNNS